MESDTLLLHMNGDARKARTYDAIVIGSGISGGWAAKELCEKGLKTLVLERGRDVRHGQDYPTANLHPWEFKYRGRVDHQTLQDNPLITKAAGYGADTAHFFIKDADHPYVQQKPFDWIRGYQVGGKSLTWGRACQRWSHYEFEAPVKLGYGLDWPVRYQDIAPWYSHVERFIGVTGHKDGLEAMPDGEFQPPFDFNCVEAHLADSIKKNFGRHLVQGRWAHLTAPTELHTQQGRTRCQARNLCMRGCPFGGYFSSNSSTLPWAAQTGNLTIRPQAVVHSILYDEKLGRASGVRIIDAQTNIEEEFYARVIFVNASALNSLLILLNSTSPRFPQGLGNDHDLLGRYVCFHNYRAFIHANINGFEDGYYSGRNPSETILVNYRNLGRQEMDYVGGFTTFSGAWRERLPELSQPVQIGAEFKKGLMEPGGWGVYMYMQGETIPKANNRVYLSDKQKDHWGMPLLVTEVSYDDNDELMLKDFFSQSQAMLEAAGCHDITVRDTNQAPGLDIHEMGGCRMGREAKTSMLNAWNQLHACQNVFVTDGACMTSTGNQSPSFLYMAFTARAVDHAVKELNRRQL